MAVTGRHSRKRYLQSQQAMDASARARFNRANSRALASSLSPLSRDASRAIWFQCPGGVQVPAPSFQNQAMMLCSAERSRERRPPSDLTSLNSVAYASLVNSGGGLGRKSRTRLTPNGLVSPQAGSRAAVLSGGVGRQMPISSEAR